MTFTFFIRTSAEEVVDKLYTCSKSCQQRGGPSGHEVNRYHPEANERLDTIKCKRVPNGIMPNGTILQTGDNMEEESASSPEYHKCISRTPGKQRHAFSNSRDIHRSGLTAYLAIDLSGAH